MRWPGLWVFYALCAVWLLIWALGNDLSQPATPPGHQQLDQQSESASAKEAERRNNPETLWQKITSEPVAFTTFCLTLVTGVLAFSTVGLWIVTARAGVRQSRDMRDSINVADRALTVVERAYISVEGLGIEDLHVRPVARVKITNAGNLPAQAVRWVIYAEIDPDDERQKFAIDDADILPSTNILPPRGEMIRFYDPVFERRDVELFETWRAVLYVWGIVYYIDGFHTWRWLRFCHRYNSDCLVSRPAVGRTAWDVSAERVRQHQYGNGTDQDADTL